MRWVVIPVVLCSGSVMACAAILGIDDGVPRTEAGVPPPPDAAVEDARADGEADAALDARPEGACPGTQGPAGVRVPVEGGSFCIDATEVTNAQYAAFLAAAVPTTGQPSRCGWNTTYTPSTWPYAAGEDDGPVRYVNWCDAVAYCTWAGKRLCGGVGGGANAFGSYLNAMTSQWLSACSHGGANAYPYGNTYQQGACDDKSLDGSAPLPVGTEPHCVGGYAGIYDMSGSVFELEDSCNTVDGGGQNDQCISRGGAYDSAGTSTTCTTAFSVYRPYTAGNTGFRCCSNP